LIKYGLSGRYDPKEDCFVVYQENGEWVAKSPLLGRKYCADDPAVAIEGLIDSINSALEELDADYHVNGINVGKADFAAYYVIRTLGRG